MSTLIISAVLTIGSPVFSHGGAIPSHYTCDGENVNPPLTIKGLPAGTKSLAVIADDPDAPGSTFDHWITWNIPPVEMIAENTSPGVKGRNSFGTMHYSGPCPPTGTHRYFFKVYALDSLLDIPAGSDRKSLEKAMKKHILAEGELMGPYKRVK